jgi:Tfp pilus assembly protein PilF
MRTTDPEAMVHEALLLDRQGRIPEAIAAYRRVLAHSPAPADCWYRLAVLQRKTKQFAAALVSYQQALDQGVRKPEEVHLNRGVIYTDDLRQHDAAERELLAALTLNPSYVPALLNLANLHEDLGRREPALAAYEQILALEPTCLEALARYANLKTFADPEDAVIGRLQHALAAPGTGAAERASLGFALGRALDACGAYRAAFAAYSRANRDSRSCAPPGTGRYDRALADRVVDALIGSFPTARSDGLHGSSAPSTAAPVTAASGTAVSATAASGPVALGAALPRVAAPRPIFVCGMFRSGSTLVEQMLAGHPRVTAGGELDLLPPIAQEILAPSPESIAVPRPPALAARYLDTLSALFPAAEFVTDKRPDNFLYIGVIKQLFPEAKIVHTVRDPLDNCLSIFFLHLDQRMSYALDLMDIGHHYREYRRLMAHWKALYGADILDVSYDALVREPKPAAEQLLGFLGLDWDPRCLTVPPTGRAIKTASVWQVREPLYQRSSGRARHYACDLDELRGYLELNR